jgi:hypothetical protein
MKRPVNIRQALVFASALQWIFACVVSASTDDPESLLRQFDESSHLRQIAFSSEEVVDHEIGLGAIQKVRGEWRFKHSERQTGTLLSYTWQTGDGYSAADMMAKLINEVSGIEGVTSLFACDGRACGRAVQWANKVFNQRVLYGREDNQQYRVFSFNGMQGARLVAYSAERTADRQYLHVELLLPAPQ